MQEIAPGVARTYTSFVNAYFIGEPGGPWALVDTGLPGFSATILAAAAERYGPEARPEAIFLTHGHFDHAGNALALANHWDVPIYAHRLELPYLTGRSDYAPPDPTVGGAIAMFSRVLPYGGRDLGQRLRVFTPDDEAIRRARRRRRTAARVGGLAVAAHAGALRGTRGVLPRVGPHAPRGRCPRHREHGFLLSP